jgi:hypothetical protein
LGINNTNSKGKESIMCVCDPNIRAPYCDSLICQLTLAAVSKKRNYNMKHLNFDCMTATRECEEQRHPVDVIKALGITYQHSTPQSLGDCWWFWNCENVPEKLPEYLTILNVDPMEYIGWSLTNDMAEKIRDYKGEETK